MHESILVYRNLFYLKWAAGLTAVCAIAYLVHRPLGPANGGTWLGYTLGVIAAALMVWLAWFGIKKRRYGKGKIPVQAWLSAHVYFGVALVVIATLHTGFRIGFNIHTLLYVLMVIVVVSGMLGVYFYVRYPNQLTDNRRGLSSDVMLAQIADLDREMRQLAMNMDDDTNAVTLRATQETIIGGSLFQRLRGFTERCPTSQARIFVEQAQDSAVGNTAFDNRRRQLLARLVRKEDLLKRVGRDIQLRSLLQIWLYFHVPFAIASLAALVTHVIVEFYYF